MQIQSFYQAFIGAILLLWAACQNAPGYSKPLSSDEASQHALGSGQATIPKSIHYFSDAEQKLSIKAYSFAAAQLHKGIIAYRVETGKMNGNAARQANNAIDALTRLRTQLRNGKAVNEVDLRQAIQHALAVEGAEFPANEATGQGELLVPVGN